MIIEILYCIVTSIVVSASTGHDDFRTVVNPIERTMKVVRARYYRSVGINSLVNLLFSYVCLLVHLLSVGASLCETSLTTCWLA